MQDQAFQLRRLAMRTGLHATREYSPKGQLVVVTGSGPRCGTTTLALNLSLALVQQGKRTILADADERRPDLSRYCQSQPAVTMADVVAGEGSIHEAITRGPGGLQIVPGGRSQNADGMVEANRLVGQLHSLAGHADAIVVDAGCGNGQIASQLCREADFVFAITAPDAASVMDTYAAFKGHFGQELPASLVPELFVNQAASDDEARDVFRRINQSCERFLGWNFTFAGHATEDAAVHEAREANKPLLLQNPASPLALICEQIAARWVQQWADMSAIRRSA